MRAARAHEDPVEMTTDATLTRLARYVTEVLRKNPELNDLQVARAARLKMRADMTKLAEKSAAARARRAGGRDAEPLDFPNGDVA